jgi:DeoR/GlpR family transcriptional regulator of sugar metabolism
VREAALLVMDGDSILLDTSSTDNYLARALSECQGLRVMTNCFEICELAQNSCGWSSQLEFNRQL